MCQMCEEYEAELRRMGLLAEAAKVRAERHKEESQGRDAEPRDGSDPHQKAGDARG